MNCCSIGTRATSIFLYIMIKSKQACIVSTRPFSHHLQNIHTRENWTGNRRNLYFFGTVSCNTTSRKHAKRNVYLFLVEELAVLQHNRHIMVLLTNLQRSFLLCSSTWGYKGQKFTIWRPSRHQQRLLHPTPHASAVLDVEVQGAEGDGHAMRRSRMGQKWLLPTLRPPPATPPLQRVMGGGRRSHGASP